MHFRLFYICLTNTPFPWFYFSWWTFSLFFISLKTAITYSYQTQLQIYPGHGTYIISRLGRKNDCLQWYLYWISEKWLCHNNGNVVYIQRGSGNISCSIINRPIIPYQNVITRTTCWSPENIESQNSKKLLLHLLGLYSVKCFTTF